MGADNYENLGFQVNVDGATDAVKRLDNIIDRLEKIKRLNENVGRLGGKGGNGGGKGGLSSTPKLTDEEKWEKQYQDKIRKQLYYIKQGYVQQKKIISDYTKWVLAEEKKLEKKRFLTEQGYIQEKPKLTEEEQFRNSFEKSKRRREFGIQEGYIQEKQNLSEVEKYLQKVNHQKDLLNSKTYEEARRIDLANQQRKKEIDQRLKQELGIKQTTKSLTAYLAKLTSVVVVARRLGSFVSSAIQESANYVENLNLFAVAYGDVYQETLDWALNLADGFGLASNEVLKFAGTFRQLSTSLGLVEDTANSVSQTVTQLGYDMSALFNTSVENAMDKLQSSIFSGNVRPLRAYGIDISQNQIDALFETNEALASLGVNARNLSQSDKVLARLIITLRDGSNAFGTMNREINTLQSQIRILQGSFANFKLAIGDLVHEPVRQALVLLNAFIIAATNIIRIFAPLKKTDENNAFNGVAMGAEEANEQIDELNGKLATFDKFNVLGGQSQNTTNTAVTEALTKELAKQQEYYKAQVKLMDDIQNEAVELAKKLEDVVAIGGTLLTTFAVSKFISIRNSTKMIAEGFAALTGSTTKLNQGLSLTNTLLITGIIYTIYKAVEAFKAGDEASGWLAVTMGVTLVGAWVLLNREAIKTTAIKIFDWIKELNSALTSTTPKLLNGAKAFEKQKISAQQTALAIGAMVGAYFFADSIINSFDGEARKTASGIMVLVGAIMAVTAALVAMNTAVSWGTMLPVLLAGVGAAIAGVKGLTTEVESISGFADGGYTNANLIMTHENGKREWVGKAAGSSAIVNDTQMSDIMQNAVSRGTYQAMKAAQANSSTRASNQTIVGEVDGETLFTWFVRKSKEKGYDLNKIKI